MKVMDWIAAEFRKDRHRPLKDRMALQRSTVMTAK
jgi:hypothetical protein